MLRKLVKFFFLGLVLLLVFLASALLAMRFAIQGREARVPRLAGLTPAEAERIANADGLVLSIESRFYSASIPNGRIVSQAPAPDSTVRRGWKIRVAESLGPQRAAVPTLIGQSQHAAGINISRRSLEIGTVGSIHFAGVAPETVVAQNPPPEATEVTSPKVGLIFSAADNGQRYVMPSFVGRSLAEGMTTVEKGGFTLGKIHTVNSSGSGDSEGGAGLILRQYPSAGQRVTAGATISFDVRK
ncbi:MAG TPA: PASTA domain-containing protein [Candidatus Angelobacter sp.]|nr:PASTA domain-containing protein [Candidatus Angelobacter sp.]